MIGPIPTARLVMQPIDQGTAAAIIAGEIGALDQLGVLQAGTNWPQADTVSGLRLEAALGGHPACWLILAGRTIIGELGWKGGPGADGATEIGYSLAPSYRAQGYGSEAVAGFVGWARAQPGVRALVADTTADNLPSRRVLEKAGFAISRTDGEHLYWCCDVSS